MTIKHMNIFIQVCKMKSVTQAAEYLNMAQPSVSKAIKELESYYNVRLFERMNRKIYITESGKKLLEYASSVTKLMKEAEEIIPSTEFTSTIRIGSNLSYGASYLLDLLVYFNRKNYPFSIYTRVDNSRRIESDLLKNELDFAIVDILSTSDVFTSTFIQSDEMIAVCTPEFYRTTFLKQTSVTLKELSAQKLLLREPGSGSREIVENRCQAFGYSLSPVMESCSSQVLLDACLKDLGILIISKKQVLDLQASGKLVKIPVSNVTFHRNYYLVYHKSKYITPSLKLFLDLFPETAL